MKTLFKYFTPHLPIDTHKPYTLKITYHTISEKQF